MPLITVTGQVSQVANEKYNYVKFWETYDWKGEPRHRIWTAWLERDLGLNEQDTVEITGDLSTKVGTYTPKDATEQKQIVEHSLNNCTVKVLKAAEPKSTQVRNAADILTQKTDTDPIDMPF